MDLLLDENKDIKIENGDLIIRDSFIQEVGLIIESSKGEWKNEPLIGADLKRLLQTKTDNSKTQQQIRLALEQDNKKLKEILFKEDGSFEITKVE